MAAAPAPRTRVAQGPGRAAGFVSSRHYERAASQRRSAAHPERSSLIFPWYWVGAPGGRFLGPGRADQRSTNHSSYFLLAPFGSRLGLGCRSRGTLHRLALDPRKANRSHETPACRCGEVATAARPVVWPARCCHSSSSFWQGRQNRLPRSLSLIGRRGSGGLQLLGADVAWVHRAVWRP